MKSGPQISIQSMFKRGQLNGRTQGSVTKTAAEASVYSPQAMAVDTSRFSVSVLECRSNGPARALRI